MTEQRTLTYDGLVDPTVDTEMGPGLDGRMWKVLGSVYSELSGKTLVLVEPTA